MNCFKCGKDLTRFMRLDFVTRSFKCPKCKINYTLYCDFYFNSEGDEEIEFKIEEYS